MIALDAERRARVEQRRLLGRREARGEAALFALREDLPTAQLPN